jgi:ribosomal protein S8
MVALSNNLLADFVVRLNVGINSGAEFVLVPYSAILFNSVSLLYIYGCINSFSIISEGKSSFLFIKVYPRFTSAGSLIKKISLISKPGLRVFWTAAEFSSNYSRKNTQGFFILSTTSGVCSSNELLLSNTLSNKLSGEVLFRVDF